MAKDPVCGMAVDQPQAAGTATHGGTSYFFCATACRERFLKDPKRYVEALEGP